MEDWTNVINGMFNAFNGVLILDNCRIAWRDQAIRGVSNLFLIFSLAWNCWNLYFYSDNIPSLLGATFSLFSVLIWFSIKFYFERKINE